MKESVSQGNPVTPMLFPYEPEQFWKFMRQMIREEVAQAEIPKPGPPVYETPGLTYKPLYKIAEVCTLFATGCSMKYFIAGYRPVYQISYLRK